MKKKYEKYMLNKIETFMNELVGEIMDKEGVTHGDIYPEQVFELDMHYESIIETLLQVVEQNKDDENEEEEDY